MLIIETTDYFEKWLKNLKDKQAKVRIAARLRRLENGNLGDVEPVGGGISELRCHYGKGYRIYFFKKDKQIIVLLCGGDKSTQQDDIKQAKQLAKEEKLL